MFSRLLAALALCVLPALPAAATETDPFELLIEGLLYIGTESIPEPPATLRNQSDEMCLAVAIYHEARGETATGRAAVASVILRRAAVPHRWGDRVCDVVVPVQFSFVRKDLGFPAITERRAWNEAWLLAHVLTRRPPFPELRGADHYHTKAVAPSWRKQMVKVIQIGQHVFYADPMSRGRT